MAQRVLLEREGWMGGGTESWREGGKNNLGLTEKEGDPLKVMI